MKKWYETLFENAAHHYDQERNHNDDQSLTEYRAIIDTDFGSIIKSVDNSLEKSTRVDK